MPPIQQQVALVTGANKGIGLEIASELARLGYLALVGARDPGRGRAAVDRIVGAGGRAAFVPIDVTDADSIRVAAEIIRRDYGRLDVLVNNAAIAMDTAPPSQTSLDTLRQTYETNVFGLVAVTQAMLPLLREAPAGRIVNMSSGAGSLTRTSDPSWRAEWNTLAYNTSKSAVNAVTVHFATELRGTSIKVNAANPGFTKTDMSPTGLRTVEQGAATPVRLATLGPDGPTGGYFDENGPIPW